MLDAIEAEDLLPLLCALSERERTVLRAARYVEDRDRCEIAQQLGVSVRRVREIERRALSTLAAAARSVTAGR